MSLTKLQAINGIQLYLSIVEKSAQLAAVAARLKAPDDIEHVSYNHLVQAHAWLKKLYEHEHDAVQKAWSLCSPQVWASYFHHGDCEDLREMKILKSALEDFRHAVNNRTHPRPRLFVRSAIRGEISKSKNRASRSGQQSKSTA